MKVLHILNELRPSGAEVMLRISARYWKDLGLDCEILSTGSAEGEYAGELRAVGYAIHHLPFQKTPGFFRKLYAFLKDGNYEIVHIHSERANFYYAVLARIAVVPTIVRSVHSVFPFHGRLRIERKLQRGLMRQLGVRFGMISPTVVKSEATYFNNSGPFTPNWFDDSKFVPPTPQERAHARQHLRLADSEFVVVAVGNCSPVKNHSAVLKALSMLNNQLRFVYLHVGEEEPGYPERKLAKDLGISERVRFYGFATDCSPFLRAADVFVMCSQHEGFGIAAVEAIAAGCSAVLSDVPGLCDLRDFAPSALWVAPNADEIARALLDLWSQNPNERFAAAAAASELVHRNFGVAAGVRSIATKLYGLRESEMTQFELAETVR